MKLVYINAARDSNNFGSAFAFVLPDRRPGIKTGFVPTARDLPDAEAREKALLKASIEGCLFKSDVIRGPIVIMTSNKDFADKWVTVRRQDPSILNGQWGFLVKWRVNIQYQPTSESPYFGHLHRAAHKHLHEVRPKRVKSSQWKTHKPASRSTIAKTMALACPLQCARSGG